MSAGSASRASGSAAAVRRVPRQQRSREKLERILDAADVLLARDGASTLTTTRIAEQAGVAVGSVYSYFADKEAIAEAIALRHWQRFADLVAATAEAEEAEAARDGSRGRARAGRTLARSGAEDGGAAERGDPLGAVFDALAAGFRGEPAFRALWYSELRTERVRDATRPVRDAVGASLARVLAVHWPAASREQLATAARMIVLVGDGVLREAFRIDPDGDPELLREGRAMLQAYAERTLG
jgi:AcrR family transcriptional regulator